MSLDKVEHFYRNNSKNCISYANRILKDEYLAQDAVHNVFCYMISSKLLDFHENPEAWLTISVRHACLNTLRGRKQEIQTDELDFSFEDPGFYYAEIDEYLRSTLSPREYMIAKKYFFEEEKESQIAKDMNLSLSNVKVIIHNIRKKLRNNILFIIIILPLIKSIKGG